VSALGKKEQFITNLYQWAACGQRFSDTIFPSSIPVTVAAASRSETIIQCFGCHSISVYRFDLLHSTENAGYSHARMCFQTSSAFSARNRSVWEINPCWL